MPSKDMASKLPPSGEGASSGEGWHNFEIRDHIAEELCHCLPNLDQVNPCRLQVRQVLGPPEASLAVLVMVGLVVFTVRLYHGHAQPALAACPDRDDQWPNASGFHTPQ